MIIDMERSLPVCVRPRHLESSASFGRRLAVANGLPEMVPGDAARQLVREKVFSSRSVALANWCEAKGQLRPEHFEKQISTVADAALPKRYMCRLCAYGDEVGQIDHAEVNCCLRHKLWIGPDTPPSRQMLVSDLTLAAERTYRRLIGHGRTAIGLLREVSSIVDRERATTSSHQMLRQETYHDVIELANELTRPNFLQGLLDPRKSFQEAHSYLQAMLDSHFADRSHGFDVSVWWLLRPTFLMIRDYLEGRESGELGVIPVDPAAIVRGISVSRPLEPFDRYLRGTRPGAETSVAIYFELHLVPGQLETPRRQVRQGNRAVEFLCDQGHRNVRTTQTAKIAYRKGQIGCPYCSGNRALAGYNSMAETQPWLTPEWDFEKNVGVTPSDIAGSGNSVNYWWLCSQGHSWKASPNSRARGKGCPYCSGRSVVPGVNSVDITDPDIACEWDYPANGQLTPGQVSAGSGVKVGWVCPRSHHYMATPVNRTRRRFNRTRRGSGCPFCANVKVLVGFNDVPTTHPWLAAEWDEEANGAVRCVDIIAGSIKPRHWRCKFGHTYKTSPSARIRGSGCPICSGRVVSPLVNSLAATNPGSAVWWHPTANGKLSPWQVTAGESRKVHWHCILGHDFERWIARYVAGPKCPVCTGRYCLPGFNDLETRHPEIASDWHPDKNEGLTAREVLAGGAKPRYWLCTAGHEQQGTVRNRIKAGGCTRCSPSERVAWPSERRNAAIAP